MPWLRLFPAPTLLSLLSFSSYSCERFCASQVCARVLFSDVGPYWTPYLFKPKNGDKPDRFLCPRCGNSRVLRALVNVAGTRIAESMLDASRALGFQAFSHWFHPMNLQRVQRKSGLNRDAP